MVQGAPGPRLPVQTHMQPRTKTTVTIPHSEIVSALSFYAGISAAYVEQSLTTPGCCSRRAHMHDTTQPATRKCTCC
jgi:hypothetical protein